MTDVNEKKIEETEAYIKEIAEEMKNLSIDDNFIIFKGNVNDGFVCTVNGCFIDLLAMSKFLPKSLTETLEEGDHTMNSHIFTKDKYSVLALYHSGEKKGERE
jgi:hypothetical protein